MGYLGSKAASGAFQAIIALMPPHDTYIETHLGSGAVMVRKPPAAKSYGIDIDPAVIKKVATIDNCKLICSDAVHFLTTFDFNAAGRVLIYADPPYVLSTRGKARYRFDYTNEDHCQLIACLSQVPASVLISGYPSTLYDQLLAGWHSFSFQVMTRGGVRTESLWFNYEPSSFHWSAFAGLNFTDRQRIKRKAERWAQKYQRLPTNERIAVLARLLTIDHSRKEL